MRTDGLSFDRIPALATPLGFFGSAPLFGVLAGLLLVIEPTALQSRWHGVTLALTHLLSLGFGAQVMLGALYQVMPVVGGQPIPHPPRLATTVRWLLTLGTLALAGGFLWRQPWLFGFALIGLLGALCCFLPSLGVALYRIGQKGDTALVVRLAALGLAIAAVLGGYQALAHALPGQLGYTPALTTAHLQWAGLGWVVLLVLGVSLQVIPMFHVTPAFPRWMAHRLAPSLFVLLLLAALPGVGGVAMWAVLLLIGVYAGYALRLLALRKRKRVDYTVRFWRLALIHLLLVCGLTGAELSLGSSWHQPVAVGVVFGAGFLTSVIFGMQLKIVPFLIYLHLQRRCLDNPLAMMQLPHMGDLLPPSRGRQLWALHLAMLALLYLSLWPGLPAPITVLAGITAMLNFGWLWLTVRQAQRRYHQACQQIAAA